MRLSERILRVGLMMGLGASVYAAPIIVEAPKLNETLVTLETHIQLLRVLALEAPAHRHAPLSRRIARMSNQLQKLSDDLQVAGFDGAWYATDGRSCSDVCRAQGLRSGRSPEGAECASGENAIASAMHEVAFRYGCFPSQCRVKVRANSLSDGRFCYEPGQKRDNDRTDVTVGCFCE